MISSLHQEQLVPNMVLNVEPVGIVPDLGGSQIQVENTILITEEKPELMFHYAAINGTKYFYDIPYQVLNDNIKMTQNVLTACINSTVEKIIYASSSEIYGEPLKIPIPETHPILLNVHTDRDSYASSKAISEFYIKLFAKENNIDFLMLRIFNTYGPHMDTSEYGQVIPEFISKMFKEKEFTIIGDGKQTRSFCYVTDHTRIVRKLTENISNEIINVGNDIEIKIIDLAEMIHKIENKTFKPKFLPEREYDHKRRCPNISKLKKSGETCGITGKTSVGEIEIEMKFGTLRKRCVEKIPFNVSLESSKDPPVSLLGRDPFFYRYRVDFRMGYTDDPNLGKFVLYPEEHKRKAKKYLQRILN